MQPSIEKELKVLLTKEKFDELCSYYQPLRFIPQHNYYYESPDKSSYAFRIRIIGDTQLFTLKHHDGENLYEYEKEFTGDFHNDAEIMDTLKKFNISPDTKIEGDLLTERAMVISPLAELCFDINHYNGLTDYEIEYEVKSEHDYLTTFQNILAKANIPFVENKMSKHKRCLSTKK